MFVPVLSWPQYSAQKMNEAMTDYFRYLWHFVLDTEQFTVFYHLLCLPAL